MLKNLFLISCLKTAFALTNTDDKNGSVMVQNTTAKTYTYALKSYADFQAQIIENLFEGLLLKINNREVYTRLIGSFNAYNLLAVYAVANILGLEEDDILKGISQLKSISGRFQYFVSNQNITVIIDYAHTPDALKNVIEAINNIRTKNENLITVIGCGGDRDKAKRPKMGHIASELSDKVVFTSDNPRSENPDHIIEQIEQGVAPHNFKKTISITDRKQAIKTACQLAKTDDIILVAGKGHETYQEINGVKNRF
jgi:UDP-N-acetylmuramoyl-L-alanyl-D-glutamate--2,6-diaminopimelate ligase